MRVGMALAAFLPATAYAGPVWNTLRIIRALGQVGVDSTVLTTTLSGPGQADLPAGPGEVEGIPIERMPVRWNYRWSPWVRWREPLAKLDVLHVYGMWNGLSYAAMSWAGRAGVPWVWEPSGMLAPRGRKSVVKRILTHYHLRQARQASGIIWTAPQERHEAPNAFHEIRHWMRPNPAPDRVPEQLPTREAARQQLGLPTEGPLWGYFGRIANRKGIEVMLRAWFGAEAAGHLIFTGPVEDHELARDLDDPSHNIHLRPPVGPEERWTLLRALDALVLVPSFGENFALVVVEAIAVGTPAVVSPAVGAGYWLAGHGAIQIDPPEAELTRLFRSAAAPQLACSLPPALLPDAIGTDQARIYGEALAGSGS